MAKHPRRLAIAAAAVLLLVASLMLTTRSRHDVEPVAHVTNTTQTRDASLVGPKPTGPHPARAQQPLPPDDAPLAQIAVPLQARADAGDSLAACRLALELLRCDGVDRAVADFHRSKRALESLEAADMLPAAQAVVETLAWQLDHEKQCRSLPPELRARVSYYLTQAARAGEPDAMLQYAEAAHLGGSDALALHDAAAFEAWRRDAPGMLQRLLRAGRAESLLLLGQAYADDNSPLAGLVPDDPVQAQAYSLMYARIAGLDEQLDLRLDPGQLARARALADTRHDQYFGSRPVGAEPLQTQVWPLAHKRPGEDTRTLCRPVPSG